MNARTLLKMTAMEHCIVVRTITRTQKSPSFYATRDELAELGCKCEVTAHDGSSFAVFQRDAAAGILTIRFVWLNGGTRLTGREEIIRIPYAVLDSFMAASMRENGPQTWKCLSRKNVRRKLLRFLAYNFQWPGSDQILFYGDSIPYSFFFREIRKGNLCMDGGLILHGQENMDTAYYSIYT